LNKFIIFDLDDTFYIYETTHQSALNAVFENQKFFDDFTSFEKKYILSKNRIQQRLASNPSKHSKLLYFKDMFEDKCQMQEILNFESIYWETFIKEANVSQKLNNFIREEKKEKDLFILCTNQNTNIQLEKVNKWKLDFFDFIITSEEVGYEKPENQFFKYVIETIGKLDNSKYNFYALGDSYENDIKYWENTFNANGYIIDNSISSFTEKNNLIHTNIQMAVDDIFN
jgi:FMN phosphatase YigB (HAD superfamily)